ncbi:MAG: nucleotide exchange factor GrpE [Bacillota bacterium]|nr:nucleotide exchange factor GrpE [Bacillota bacterium]
MAQKDTTKEMDILEEEIIEEVPIEEEESVDLAEELEALKDKHLRLQAEYQNYRSRTQKEKEALLSYANEKLLLHLLPVLDNFARAKSIMGQIEGGEAFTEGIELIERSLDEFVKKESLEPLEAVGEAFDPNMHHAVLMEEAEGTPEGIVLEVLQTGYKLRDKIIRPAMVKVSK